MEKRQEYWEGLAAGYFFLSATGAMMFVTIALLDLLGAEIAGQINGLISLAALVITGIGGLMLFAELGNKMKAYLAIGNLSSKATQNIMFMSALIGCAFIYATFFFDFIPWYGYLGVQKAFAVLGIIAALALVVIHGMELGEARGRSFWHGSALVPVFIITSAASGMAGVLLMAAALGVIKNPAVLTVNGVMAGFLILQLIAVVSYIQGMKHTGAEEAKRSVENILQGEFQLSYWGGIIAVGTIIPLLMYAFAASAAIVAVKAILVIIGGICFRSVFLQAAVRVTLPGEEKEWTSPEEAAHIGAALEKRWQEKAAWLYKEN